MEEKPKRPDPVEECIEYLRSHGDWFGVSLLEEMQRDGQKDPQDS